MPSTARTGKKIPLSRRHFYGLPVRNGDQIPLSDQEITIDGNNVEHDGSTANDQISNSELRGNALATDGSRQQRIYNDLSAKSTKVADGCHKSDGEDSVDMSIGRGSPYQSEFSIENDAKPITNGSKLKSIELQSDEICAPSDSKQQKKDGKRALDEKKQSYMGLSAPYLDDMDLNPEDTNFTIIDILSYILCIGSYLADVGTDIWVAYTYFHSGHLWWFILTVIFIAVPAIVTTSFSLSWYYRDYKEMRQQHAQYRVSPIRWASRSIFLFLQIGPIIRYIDCLIYGVKSKKEEKCNKSKLHWYKQMLMEDTDSALLRLFECFLEAAPQLVLQLYIITKYGFQGGIILVIGQSASCFTSLTSLSWALASYHKALRMSLAEKAKLTFGGMTLVFVWRFFTIGARVLALALFASQFSYWMFLVVACHWLVMFVWILAKDTQFCPTKCEEILFNVIVAIVYVFCYLNLVEGHTRLRYAFYYVLVYAENAALILVWYTVMATSSSWYVTPAMCAVLGGFFIGTFFQLIYYTTLHPNNAKDNGKERIQCCVPWEALHVCKNPPPAGEQQQVARQPRLKQTKTLLSSIERHQHV